MKSILTIAIVVLLGATLLAQSAPDKGWEPAKLVSTKPNASTRRLFTVEHSGYEYEAVCNGAVMAADPRDWVANDPVDIRWKDDKKRSFQMKQGKRTTSCKVERGTHK